MALQMSHNALNAALDAIEAAIGASPALELRSGLPPASCASPDTGTLLATMTLPADWMQPANAGGKSKLGQWRTSSALASGTVGHFRIRQSGTVHMQGVVTAEDQGGDMEVSSVTITAGTPVDVVAFSIAVQDASPVVVTPQLSVALLTPSQDEGNSGTVTWTARITAHVPVPTGGCSFSWAVAGTGANPANAADFGGVWPSGTASMAAGAISTDVTFTTTSDALDEPDETFAVTLTALSGCVIAGAPAVGTIVNDDVPPPPPVTFAAVNPDGWTVDYGSDLTVDTPLLDDVTVNRPGFNALGQPIVRPYALKTTRRRLDGVLTRQPMPRTVALSDYLYEGDTITGATGESLVTSPKPIVKWACEDRLVIGNTGYASAIAAHRDAGEGKQIACVRYTWTDALGTTVTAIVSAPTPTAHPGWWRQCPAWQATVDLSGLQDGTVRLDVEAFPRFGTDASVFRSTDVPASSHWLARTLYFRKDVAKASAPPIAVVNYLGAAGTIEGVSYGAPSAAGVVSTNPATARATPFDSIANAQAALLGATYAGITKQDLGGCEIWLAGSPASTSPLDNGTNRTTSGYALTIRRDPLLSKDACAIPNINGRLRHGLGRASELDAWKVRFVGLKIARPLGGTIRNADSGSTIPLDVWMIDCDIDWTDSASALVAGFGRALVFWGCRNTNDGAGTCFTARTPQGAISFYGTRTVASEPVTRGNDLEAVTHVASEFVGYNKTSVQSVRGWFDQFLCWHSNYCLAFHSSNILFGGTVFANCAWINGYAESHGDGTRLFRLSGDGNSQNTDNNIFHNFTIAGRGGSNGGMNNYYDDNASVHRTHTRHSIKGCVTQSLAFKGGEQASPQTAANDGAFPHGHGVGHRDNFQAGSTAFNKRYAGVGFRGSQDIDVDPMFTDPRQWANSTWGDTSALGAGMGNYRPLAGSPLKGGISDALTSHDLDMVPRPLTGDTIGCYV